MDDQILQLAFSIYHNPGVYALLLGSGVSRSANIPTGQEVTNDLIRRIALGLNQEISGEPYTWYMEQYGEEPRYDTLIEKLGITAFERHSLLQEYFEPTDEERQQGIKLPSRAHRSIAKLIKSGHIRVVLTTNFDRLLEKALEDEGVIPDVISTVDALKGARPLQHSPITIIKLHGDYRDGRIKNTAQELAKYDKRIDQLLDRVLDEYGLIICGWSAEWDTALRNALYRGQGRRYTTYWASYGKLTDNAQLLSIHRQAQVINIKGADDFFFELEQCVGALQSSNQRHPLSIPVAVERVKKLLSSPQAYIELREFFHQEAERSHERITSQQFYVYLRQKMPKGFQNFNDVGQYADLYYQEIELVLRLVATLCWYDSGNHTQVITDIHNRWIEIPKPNDDAEIAYLPVLLLMYTAGIAALKQNNWPYLQAIFHEPFVPTSTFHREKDSSFLDLLAEKSLRKLAGNSWTGLTAQLNRILQARLRPVFEYRIPSNTHYSYTFDLFEMLLSFAYLATSTSKLSSNWMPPHLACVSERSWEYINSFWFNGGKRKQAWKLLHIEPFASKQAELSDILVRYVQVARSIQKSDPHADDEYPVPDYSTAYMNGTGNADWKPEIV